MYMAGNPEPMRRVGRSRPAWEDNIKTDRKDMRREGVGWIYLALDSVQFRGFVNMVMNQWVT